MPSLHTIKNRIRSIRATYKLTTAMKMVAAARLRQTQHKTENGRNYAQAFEKMVLDLSVYEPYLSVPSPLLNPPAGPLGKKLVFLMTSNRGLCGSFNTQLVRHARQVLTEDIDLVCFGKRGYTLLKGLAGVHLASSWVEEPSSPKAIAHHVIHLFEKGIYQSFQIIYPYFKNVLLQGVQIKTLVPLTPNPEQKLEEPKSKNSFHLLEPSVNKLLPDALERNIAIQLQQIFWESESSEQGARMTAMDNASRNAREMIQGLELHYNRSRQAFITKELIEIISGADAL